MNRVILHSDMNACYASIEQARRPELRGKAMAVCGSQEARNGIILAKSQEAKEAGVKTGEVIWQAQAKCPDLVLVPADFEHYLHYSRLAQEIYLDYTDKVQPYGMDECWLDLTGTQRLFGPAEEVACEIRQRFREELGITLSIGISDNMIFAKLGSDYKKPDAQTVINQDNYREIAWPLPVQELFFVGPRTTAKLRKYGILTIGDLAQRPASFLKERFGINGLKIWKYANGKDDSQVQSYSYQAPIKSVGNGTTFRRDLVDNNDLRRALLKLSQQVSSRLIDAGLAAKSVQISLRRTDLFHEGFHSDLPYPTQNAAELALYAYKKLEKEWSWPINIRALTIRAINLVAADCLKQRQFLEDYIYHEKSEALAQSAHELQARYGANTISYASIYHFELADLDSAKAELPASFM